MCTLLTTSRKRLMSPCSVFIFSARIGTAFGVEPQRGAVKGDLDRLLVVVVEHKIVDLCGNGEAVDLLIAAVRAVVGHFFARPREHMMVFVRPIVAVDAAAPAA